MKNLFLIVAMGLCFSSCVKNAGLFDDGSLNALPNLSKEDENKIKELSIDGKPIRITPMVEITNTKVLKPKNLFVINGVSDLCLKIKNQEFTIVNEPFQQKEKGLKDVFNSFLKGYSYTKKDEDFYNLVTNYEDNQKDDFMLVLNDVFYADFDNDGKIDKLFDFNVKYNKKEMINDDEMVFSKYEYGYLSYEDKGKITDFEKGDEGENYYQDALNSFQKIITVDTKNYLATFNKHSKIKRVDEIISKDNKKTNHALCEF